MATEVGVFGATAVGVLSAGAVPIVLGATGITLMCCGLYTMAKRFKGVVSSSISE